MVRPLRASDSCRVKKIDEYLVEMTLRLLELLEKYSSCIQSPNELR